MFYLLRKILFLCFVFISIIIVWLNYQLYTNNFNKDENTSDIQFQLNFLKTELRNNNLGSRMQTIYPEGFVFINVLYGLSWCEVGLADQSLQTKELARTEALFAYNEISSDKAKCIFDDSIVPAYGIFYRGWKNYLLSKILLLDTNFVNYRDLRTIYFNECESIADALQRSNTPYLESYKGLSWPADNFVALASLSNYSKIYDSRYNDNISRWMIKVKSKLDPKTELIPHQVNYENGETIEGARGCSISLVLRLMSEIDTNFAKKQFALFKEKFVTTILVLPSVREYPMGESGYGDIDSGPVVFGVGFAGTIVSIGTFSVFGDQDLATFQYKTINAFGFSYKKSQSKKYLFGLLPIADAFIAWSRSSGLNLLESNSDASNFWRFKFLLFSIIPIAFGWGLCFINPIFIKK